MTEPLDEPSAPRTVHPPTQPTDEIARRNALLGWSLAGIVLLIAGGAVLVAFVYLHFD
jgi:hypothetical protein